jgi:curved DNA-binding protein CbpA
LRYDDRRGTLSPTQQYALQEMAGQLSEHSTAELIQEICASTLSGALRLEKERLKVAVYFEDGKAIYAAANVRELRLSEYLRAHRLVPEHQLATFNGQSDQALSATLVSKGIIDTVGVETVLAAFFLNIIRVPLSWKEGTWEFDDRTRLAETLQIKVDTAGLLLEFARRAEFDCKQFPNPDEVISPIQDQPASTSLSPSEGFVLSRVSEPIKLSELVLLSGLPEMEVLKTVHALVLAGFLRRESRVDVLKEGAAKHKPAPKPSPPPTPVIIAAEVQGLTEEEELKQFFDRMERAVTHYEVLDVSSSSEVSEIKRAYYSLARRYHPDRFHSKIDVHSRVESAFARIAQAYETLINQKHRATYDAKLAAQDRARKIGEAAPKARKDSAPKTANKEGSAVNAEKSFRDGYAALQLGQTAVAITHLAAAAKAAPDEPRYRAYYGQALATNGRSHRLAEIEMQAAVKLEPQNVSYRIMLARLFFDLGFVKRAKSEVERVLELEKDNSEANELLQLLQAK